MVPGFQISFASRSVFPFSVLCHTCVLTKEATGAAGVARWVCRNRTRGCAVRPWSVHVSWPAGVAVPRSHRVSPSRGPRRWPCHSPPGGGRATLLRTRCEGVAVPSPVPLEARHEEVAVPRSVSRRGSRRWPRHASGSPARGGGLATSMKSTVHGTLTRQAPGNGDKVTTNQPTRHPRGS